MTTTTDGKFNLRNILLSAFMTVTGALTVNVQLGNQSVVMWLVPIWILNFIMVTICIFGQFLARIMWKRYGISNLSSTGQETKTG